MSYLEALILGIIQGLTEFLPVSSSGHIELGKVMLDVKMKDPLLFSIVVHGATALSTIVIFWKTIWSLLTDLFKFQWNESTQYAGKILVSMIPVGLVGVLYESQIEALFDGEILLVGLMLLVTGALLFLTTRVKETTGEVTFPKAIIIGLAQAIAILPGISRSGATISTALLSGISRENSAHFSFLMVLPPIIGAMLLKVKKYSEVASSGVPATESIDSTVLIIGFVAAFLTGLLACTWMIQLVKKGKLTYFAIYCFVVGAIAIGYSLLVGV
ncbi:MAG: undecaprenyl-diphosphatase [Flammeovirgaceae bacterium]|jgi:undecaprenyl-diphosphatase